ncbi:MAG: DUF998 domain-containing protein [Candidatus Thermoplasmatota archaeon]|jgi:hypothetical membrane protein|nr:DUF998 domain-containing protein [Candidatus Thermoplasmatota archaeon]
MNENSEKKMGAFLILIGLLEFYIFTNIAEFVQPVYSVSHNSISHLGIATDPYIFNGAIIVLGICEIVGGYFFRKYSMAFFIFMFLAGIGSAGVGIFNENYGYIHFVFAVFAFLLGAAASYIILYRERKPITVIWAILGTISIIALILFGIGILGKDTFFYFGLGEGGMERMILIPDVMWALGYTSSVMYSD